MLFLALKRFEFSKSLLLRFSSPGKKIPPSKISLPRPPPPLTAILKTLLINMNRHESLLEYQRLVPEAHQLFGPVFTKNRLVLLHAMLHFPEK